MRQGRDAFRVAMAGLVAGARGGLLAIVLFSGIIAVAIGGEPARLVIVNSTPHVVRAVIADRMPLDLEPGARTTFESGRAANVPVKVSYAPGQGVEGNASRVFHLAPPAAAAASGGYVYFACRTSSSIVAPAAGEPTTWSVTADTLGAAPQAER